MRAVYALTAALLLIGCAGPFLYMPPESRQAYIDEHPDLDIRICKAITAGVPIVGMTEEQVVATIGKPSYVNRTVTGSTIYEQWVYEHWRYKTRYLYFENGIFTSWQG